MGIMGLSREAQYLHDKYNPEGLAAPVKLPIDRKELARIMRRLGYTKGAEVGVCEGRYSKQICEQVRGVDLLCVDPWITYKDNPRGGPQAQHDRNIEITKRILEKFNVTIKQAFSMDAVREMAPDSLDFVYIDAHHGFDYVMQDIIEWAKRVRPGGMVAGHDYYHFRLAGVVEAVDAYTDAHGINEWFVTSEKEASWFWVKR